MTTSSVRSDGSGADGRPANSARTALLRRDPLLGFVLISVGAYIAWYLVYALVVHPWGVLDHWLIDRIIDTAGTMLRALGYVLIPEPGNVEQLRTIGVEGGHLLWIGDPCDGLGLMAVYLIFIAAYPGPWRHKAWFAVLGVISIHLINSLRVAALCIVVSIDYEWLNFNHDYTFYVIVYGWVFLLWYIWARRFGPPIRSASRARA